MMKRVFILLGALVVLAISVNGQTLSGKIFVDKSPLKYSKVYLENSAITEQIFSMTDQNGEFFFDLEDFNKQPKPGEKVNVRYCVDSPYCVESSTNIEISTSNKTTISIYTSSCTNLLLVSIYFRVLDGTTISKYSEYQRASQLREDDVMILDKVSITNNGDCTTKPFSLRIDGSYNEKPVRDAFGLSLIEVPPLSKNEEYSFEPIGYEAATYNILGTVKNFVYADSNDQNITLNYLRFSEKGTLKLIPTPIQDKDNPNNIIAYIKDYEEGITETFKIKDKTELENINILSTILEESRQGSKSNVRTNVFMTSLFITISVITAILTTRYQTKGYTKAGKKLERMIKNVEEGIKRKMKKR